MERRVTSHTEEEEMNQRRRLLGMARKGDERAISKLFELYQVKVYTGETLKKSKTSFSKDPQPLNSEKKLSAKSPKPQPSKSKKSTTKKPKVKVSSERKLAKAKAAKKATTKPKAKKLVTKAIPKKSAKSKSLSKSGTQVKKAPAKAKKK